ncbi:floral homeotic protein PMADS 1-like [Rutidosis leptorrhynchoides]|uniref:floral homeotic protein PMADS 1-like n=1 Tax=Rutidosis leptorrhynchoides TaxID=125765 RepID=UPI003A98D94A
MARGKIQIKRIENITNRQVTYSKRRNGLFKKANELTVLCDAKVSIIMLSSTGKLHEYISPSITRKQLFDQYQKTLGIDLWNTHYERMQEQLRKLKDVNKNLRLKIRQRMGEHLNNLSFEQLVNLDQDMDNALRIIRERKYKVIANQTETYKKKVRNVQEIHRNLLHELSLRERDPQYGLVFNDGGDYEEVIDNGNIRGPRIFALRMQQFHHSSSNHHHQLSTNNINGATGSDLTTYHLLE